MVVFLVPGQQVLASDGLDGSELRIAGQWGVGTVNEARDLAAGDDADVVVPPGDTAVLGHLRDVQFVLGESRRAQYL